MMFIFKFSIQRISFAGRESEAIAWLSKFLLKNPIRVYGIIHPGLKTAMHLSSVDNFAKY